ncbi:uncharacterized protein BDR25DRAFT_351950 [Lindgomyces ingoldianus]|uniref:Uncharacterized protein n=1 Tax=Lindgomyces ingoldianus TaxID=673940 RepID=A0ACB6R514_9PLEO|nr:uncharacterized protein BDR25DRAFT_351950 [Lindgomyces ingoldianus]KAF2474409.1 hypothetical protein BDR25DRAFT_351950 [Lindgomyces ingoldianus]
MPNFVFGATRTLAVILLSVVAEPCYRPLRSSMFLILSRHFYAPGATRLRYVYLSTVDRTAWMYSKSPVRRILLATYTAINGLQRMRLISTHRHFLSSTFVEDVTHCLAPTATLTFVCVSLVNSVEVGMQTDLAWAHLCDDWGSRSVHADMGGKCHFSWPHTESKKLSPCLAFFQASFHSFCGCCQDLEQLSAGCGSSIVSVPLCCLALLYTPGCTGAKPPTLGLGAWALGVCHCLNDGLIVCKDGALARGVCRCMFVERANLARKCDAELVEQFLKDEGLSLERSGLLCAEEGPMGDILRVGDFRGAEIDFLEFKKSDSRVPQERIER